VPPQAVRCGRLAAPDRRLAAVEPGRGHAWEPVIVYSPVGRRARLTHQVPDVLVEPAPAIEFTGAKPSRWTYWVLDAMGFAPATDTVDDLFPGSGLVSAAANAPMLPKVSL
jgi:hypothetical protein